MYRTYPFPEPEVLSYNHRTNSLLQEFGWMPPQKPLALTGGFCFLSHFMHKGVPLRDPSWGLAWSNPSISDDTLIRKALTTGRFSVILQACLDYGLERVRQQWSRVLQHPELTSPKLRWLTGDILDNISQGFSQAMDQFKSSQH